MKRIVLVHAILLCTILNTVAQSNNLTIRQFRLDSTTAIGKPVGEKVTQEIDKDGGTIFSEDGRIELKFPQGALSKKKKISIQPVTNMVANGRGDAYQFEPSGLQFEKPVTLILHYSDDELSGTSAEFKSMAWQDDKGKWQALPETIVDSSLKTITTQIDHFSSYASFDKIVMLPRSARVKVEKTVHMEIHFILNFLDEDIALPPTIPASQWSVNGIQFGNTNVGKISPLTTNSALFTAPVSVPDENPVAVSAKLTGMEFKFKGKTFRDPSLVSNVLIYDKAYRVMMDVWVDNSSDGICTMRSTDHGEFTVILEGTRSMIKEISNRNLVNRINPCPCAIFEVGGPTPGPINTIGVKQMMVTPASLPANPFRKVRIMLNHAFSPMPVFKTACPARMPMPPVGAVYLPSLIEFEAKDDPEQKITLSELTHGSMANERRYGITIMIKLIEENNR